jgi:ATP-dependent exoDNAse (exonuclease V) beta subunit
LLEPSSMHLGLSPLPAVSSLIDRVTASKSFTEPNPRLTGKFFHKLMEFLPRHKTELTEDEFYALAGQLDETIAHPQLISSLIAQERKLLSIYAGSDFQQIMASAKTICHEWSYYQEADDKLRLFRPDLLLEGEDGSWYLIDYKTDQFPLAEINQQALRHRPQLERYREDFTALTNIKPQLAIYFAQHGILHKLP